MAQNEITKVLSNRLEELTERKRDIDYRLSDKKQAEQMGIPYPTFVKYKGDKAECPISTIVKMAEYYGVSTDYLLGLQKEPTNNPNEIAVTEYTRLTKKAIENVIELTPQLRNILNKILEHKKLLYFFTIVKTAFHLKHNILKKGFQRPTDNDEKKAAQAEKILENTPYSVAFTFDELFGYEYQFIEQIKKIIDDAFYELESEDSNNG